ncbi:MAG: DUF4446 family protein [Acetivibrionales bacterium]
MEDLFNISLVWLIIGGTNILLILILIILNISTHLRIKRLKDKYDFFMNGEDNLSLEGVLEKCIIKVNNVAAKSREIENHINKVERNLLSCVQKVGIVRYNAFDNVGSDLSFSLALLDSNDNGIVLSGLYSRDSTATYAKPIINGKSKYALSAEEIKAISIAKKRAYNTYTDDFPEEVL